MEVLFFWAPPWKLFNAVFLLVRYLPFATSINLLYQHFHSGINPDACLHNFRFLLWMFSICGCLSEMILTVRTWALWESDRKLGLLLSVSFVSIWTTIFVLLQRQRIVILNVPPSHCFATSISRHFFIIWLLLMCFQLVTLILMSIKGYQTFRNEHASGLWRAVYVNGILYYIYLFTLFVANVVASFYAPHVYLPLLQFLPHIMQSVLTCRMLFELRQYGNRTVYGDNYSQFTSEFTAPRDSLVFQQAAVSTQLTDIEPNE